MWRARDEALSVDVAVKQVLLPGVTDSPGQAELLARAAREARNAAQLRDHPNVVAVYDVVIDDGTPWTVMQLVEGRSLQEQLDAFGPLSVTHATQVAAALLRALGAAHRTGIVHRDVKPPNVMLASNGEILLTDFGIALHHADTALTATGMLVGTPGYIAPERMRGADSGGPGDLFSLGVTLYQAVEGTPPFRRDAPAAVIFDQPPPPRHRGRLTQLIVMLLKKDPNDRPTITQALAMIDAPSARDGRMPATRPGSDATLPKDASRMRRFAKHLGLIGEEDGSTSRPSPWDRFGL